MFKLNKNNDLDIKLEFNLEQHKKSIKTRQWFIKMEELFPL